MVAGLVAGLIIHLATRRRRRENEVLLITLGVLFASTAIATISFLLAGLLLFGGISLVKKRHRAAPILFIWSILKTVLVFASIGLQLSMQTQVMDQAAAQLQTVPGGRAIMGVSIVVGLAGGLIFALAGPIFLLVWFRRGVIKEEVATWK